MSKSLKSAMMAEIVMSIFTTVGTFVGYYLETEILLAPSASLLPFLILFDFLQIAIRNHEFNRPEVFGNFFEKRPNNIVLFYVISIFTIILTMFVSFYFYNLVHRCS